MYQFTGQLQFNSANLNDVVLPHREMGAYEALWLPIKASFKSIAETIKNADGVLPSALVDANKANDAYKEARELLSKSGVERFGIRVNGTYDYPTRLRDAEYPVELLYYQGKWDYVHSRAVAIVGTRQPSFQGVSTAKRLAEFLAKHDITVVSGLAAGIDTAAHTAAIDAGGRTIAVIGTPLGKIYPRDNRDLQKKIVDEHLLISQVPIVRYAKSTPATNRFFFRPEMPQ